MKDEAKSKKQLIFELKTLRQRYGSGKKTEIERKGPDRSSLSGEFFRAITENSSDIVLIVDEGGVITYASPSIERFAGYKPDELVGKSGFEFIIPPDRPRAMLDFYNAILTKAQLIPNAFRIRHKDGSERVFEGLGKGLLDNPAVAGFVMNVRDVSERARAEEELRQIRGELEIRVQERTEELTKANEALQSEINERRQTEEALRLEEKRYGDLADLLPQTIYETDENGNLIFVNRAAFDNFGYTREDFDKGLNIIQMVAPQERAGVLEAFQKSVSGEKYGRGIEITALRKDRTTFPAIAFSSPIIKENKNTGVRGFIIDISHQMEREKELRISREQLRALAADQQRILENERVRISREIHDELGQMLTALKMELVCVSKGPSQKEKTKTEKMAVAFGLIDQMVRVVRKICSELRPPVLDDFGLCGALEWETQEFQKRTGIECTFTSSLEGFDLERELSINLFRIFQETLTNIARHSKGTRIHISLEKECDSLVLKVEDNGKGITPYRIADPKSLGLLGMRERALLFGGKVDITGLPGRGTMVSVHIPLSRKK